MCDRERLLAEWDCLDQMLKEDGCTRELSERWLNIWERFVTVSDHAVADNIALLSLYIGLGWRMASEQNLWTKSASILDYYFKSLAHLDDILGHSNMLRMRAVTYLYTCQESDAAHLYRGLLSSTDPMVQRISFEHSLFWVYIYCVHRPPDQIESLELTDLVRAIAFRVGVPRRRWVTLPAAATYRELSELLFFSHPRQERDAAKMCVMKLHYRPIIPET